MRVLKNKICFVVLFTLLISACATTTKHISPAPVPDAPICGKPITGNSCIDEVEKDYCDKIMQLAPDVQEIVQHDVLCAHHEGNQEMLDKLHCYKDDAKAVAAMKLYWDKPEGQALVYFVAKYEKAKASCAN